MRNHKVDNQSETNENTSMNSFYNMVRCKTYNISHDKDIFLKEPSLSYREYFPSPARKLSVQEYLRSSLSLLKFLGQYG